MLERTVREARSDREMSAADLLREKAGSDSQYVQALAFKRERIRGYGFLDPQLAWLAPERMPWPQRLRALWGRITGRPDPIRAMAADKPLLASELELWRLEREALLRRSAGLEVEFHKKFSLPAACVVFVLLGAPLGMRVRRAGPAVAFVSVAFFLFYWLALIGGEELAERLLLPPWLAMWLPNLVLGTWGALATLRAAELLQPRRRALRPLPRAA
jgi:lipopolysaccharide export system permease protein